MTAIKELKFASKPVKISTAKCRSYKNRVTTTEYARLTGWDLAEGARIEKGEESTVKVYHIERCKADVVRVGSPSRDENGKPRPLEHPFGRKEQGPVLTCREMRMNGCREDELYQGLH